MKENLVFHHIGVATRNMMRARCVYQTLGYSVGILQDVPSQHVRVCFAEMEGQPMIELIEPASNESPIGALLNKVGSGPYHVCYTTPDLRSAEAELLAAKFVRVGDAFLSGPLGEQPTQFFYSANVGLIELTEQVEG